MRPDLYPHSFYIFTWKEYLGFGIIFACYVILQLLRRGPSVESFRHLVEIVDTRGGNILLLAALAVWFFKAAMQLFYYALFLITTKALTPENAVLMLALTFVTGTAFGSAMGALLKTLTGTEGMVKAAPPPPEVPAIVTPPTEAKP